MTTPRILIVDDSLTIRRALEFILKPLGYELAFAVDGRDALEKANDLAPDLVLLDYVLPDMRGPDVCTALSASATTAQTPVILVSAKGASIRQTYQDAQNVVSYITKPFKQQVVVSVVQNALERRRGRSIGEISTEGADAANSSEAESTRLVGAPVANPSSSGAGTTPQRPPGPAQSGRRPRGSIPNSIWNAYTTLLAQLEESFVEGGSGRIDERLQRVARAASDLTGHLLPSGALSPFRLGRDGAVVGLVETVLDAHQALCEAAIALTLREGVWGGPVGSPDVVVLCPEEVALAGELRAALHTVPTDRVLWLRAVPRSLPAAVKLLAPHLVLAPRELGQSLESIIGQLHTQPTATTRWIGIVAADAGDSLPTESPSPFDELRPCTSELAHLVTETGSAAAASPLLRDELEIVVLE